LSLSVFIGKPIQTDLTLSKGFILDGNFAWFNGILVYLS